ncbi:MAG: twin transmembrane helix small protein [Gammaproteobacteria bacterium]|nr:twin transmembrane helix small protein [Gammaproteobacteria bacterium]
MLFKILIILMLIAILVSLASGMFFLVKDKGQSKRMVNSLTFRVSLSVALFVLLFVGYATGLIKPHGIVPAKTEKALPEAAPSPTSRKA